MPNDELRELIDKVDLLYNTLPKSDTVNYFQAMERCLYNYRRMQKIVQAEDEYKRVELQERSRGIVSAPSGSPVYRTREEVLEDVAEQKAREYLKTRDEFSRIARVVESFANNKEFAVVRMYYFGESPKDGSGGHKYTMDDIASHMGMDAGSVRRWRNNIVNDMSVCMFNLRAAMQATVYKKDKKLGS